MAFDYRKFENSASSVGFLVRLGCSREVLKHAACGYAIASAQPGEYRKALREAGESVKKLERQVRAARELSRLLSRLQHNPRITLASSTQQQAILCWRQALEEVAQWLNALPVFRPDAKEAALALAMHVKQRTGQRHLSEICKLLKAALAAAGLPDSLTPESLRKQIARASRQRAEELQRGWELLAPAKKQAK